MTGGDGDKQVSGMTRIGADRAAGRRPPWWAAVAAVALVVAVPVATWWLVGDQTTPRVKRLRQGDPYPPDYALFPPFKIAPATERAVGVVAVVLVVAWLTGRLHVGWWGVLGLLSLVGAGWGWMWRVLTAVVDEPDFSGIVVLMVPIGLGLVWVAMRGARGLLAPGQPPTTGGSSATTQGRSPTE
jgi:hypothetical protein